MVLETAYYEIQLLDYFITLLKKKDQWIKNFAIT